MEQDPFGKLLLDPIYSNAAIGERLKRVRVDVMHIRTRREMARRIGVEEDTYGKAEQGYGLSRQMALRICLARPGLTLDWLDRGKGDGMPLELLRLLGEAP